ncbi:class I SAM-dependent methyltransferase [Aquimarina sp. D1M17]|uniref:class I SAM-dependent methyltransferase n=1 Tax=Aquimarina acroporae TaxID=2937283 RepID=UPI0020C046BB|nr:class I SAM-dependent methyltransferase [Aquimarina acroporae]MCK8522837.1 class I SAM-dependent methyltransferase [Aquimarina acroporae]
MKKKKQPWPTKDAMEQIYEMKLWGDYHSSFYSGSGSHDPNIVDPYIAAVTQFLTSFKTPITLCDLGCGDFNIGRQLLSHTQKYIAVDIVNSLIAHNRTQFEADHLEFYCLDIAKDKLPDGDCALVRQVLQHLSNQEVAAILEKLNKYRYIVLTEHLPNGSFIPNKDIISGQGIRLKKQSGLDILAPPFNFKVFAEKQLLATIPQDHKGVITTTLYQVW